MTRVMVLGGGCAGLVALDWSLARVFPLHSAVMREAARCPICRAHAAQAAEREAA